MRTDPRLRYAQVEIVGVRTLRGYERNARDHSDAQVGQIARAIEEFGFTNPLLVDEHGVLIAGHGRLDAARKLGMQEVPVIRITGLTEARKAALVLADNRIALNSTWNEKLLAENLRDLQVAADAGDLDLEGGLEALGFGDAELKEYSELLLPPEAKEEPRDVTLGEEPHVCRAGDRWALGPHMFAVGGASGNDLRAADALIISWERQNKGDAQQAGGGKTFKARAADLGIEFKRVDAKAQKARTKGD